MTRRRRAFAFIVALAPVAAAAQGRPTVRGEVLLADSATRVAGVVVAATDAAGAEVVRALTGRQGEFLIELPGAGTFGFRALRIGYKPTTVAPMPFAAGESRTIRIVLGTEAVALATVRVRGETSCRIREDSGQLVARVWEQARGALAATQLDAGGRPVDATIVSFRHELEESSRTIRSESLVVSSSATRHVFRSAPPESLATTGYVVPVGRTVTYHAPDAGALLSDPFAALHCFSLEPPPPTQQGWVGISFRPARERRGISEIEGTLWLDRATSELRRLDYKYVNMPRESGFADADGWVEFARLTGGDWIVTRWAIKMPVTERRVLPGMLNRTYATGTRIAGGEARRIRRDSVDLYASEGETMEIRVSQQDTVIRAAGTIVMLSGTDHVAVADSQGIVRIRHLVAGRYRLLVQSDLMEWIDAPAVEREVEVSAGAPNLATVTLPPLEQILSRRCPYTGWMLVYGIARNAADRPVADARLVVHWSVLIGGNRRSPPRNEPRVESARTDEYGRWSLCLPKGTRLTLEAYVGDEFPMTRDVFLMSGPRLLRLDVSPRP